MSELRLGVIGAGNMATAILHGVRGRNVFPAERIIVSDRSSEKLEVCRELGCSVTTDNRRAAERADVLLLAVKPQSLDEVLDELSGHVAGKCVVSIVAGVSRNYLHSRLGADYVVRVMPNTPLLVGMGASAVTGRGEIPEPLYEKAVSLFSAAGEVAAVGDDRMNEIIFVNGSSPAFFFRMADAMVQAAKEQGIDPDTALRLAARTMEGSANMLLRSGKTAHELTVQVSSPGGTTLAALTAFDEFRFEEMISEAARRCTRRAYEIGK